MKERVALVNGSIFFGGGGRRGVALTHRAIYPKGERGHICPWTNLSEGEERVVLAQGAIYGVSYNSCQLLESMDWGSVFWVTLQDSKYFVILEGDPKD